MNERIKQLTKNYLDNLNLGGGRGSLNERQKNKIVKINSESEWIIFNAGSLKAERKEAEDYGAAAYLEVDRHGKLYINRGRRTSPPGRYENQQFKNFFLVNLDNYLREYNYNLVDGYSIEEEEEDEVRIAGYEKSKVKDYSGEWKWVETPIYELDLDHEGKRKRKKTGRRFIKARLRKSDGTVTDEERLNYPGEKRKYSYSPEFFTIVSPTLRNIIWNAIKVYEPESISETDIIEKIQFTGGRGSEPGSGYLSAITTDGDDKNRKGDKNYWVAVNKVMFSEHYSTSFVAYLNNDRRHWREEKELENLLTANDIINSKEKESENNSDTTEPNFPPPLPTDFTADSVSFILGRVEKLGSSSYIFRLTPQSPFTFQGKQINTVVSRCQEIVTLYQNGDLEAGKLITIAKIQLNTEEGWWEHDKEHIEGNKLSIPKLSKAEISVVYGAVRQKNIELAQEENSWLNLVTELTSIIKKNNTEVCSEAAKLGLKLPAVPLDTLKFFQEDFFVELEEKIPLTNPTNQQIIAANESIRKKKENIKTNIYQIYNRNLKRLADYKDQDPNSTSELDQLKNQVIEAINKVLTDKDNLRNIDLTTLEDGKYLNWEEDLDQLLEKEEVTAYQQNFLAVLKKLIAQERTKDDPSKSLPQNNEQIDISKISKASSLTEARNIAKKLIRELFVKYRVKLEDVETIWLGKGEKSWMEYLNKLNDYEQVKHFVQEFEEQAKQKAGLLNPTNSASLAPLFTWLIIGSIIIVGLTLIIGLIYQKYHSKEK